MKKHLCDICEGDLFVSQNVEHPLAAHTIFYTLTNPFKVVKRTLFACLPIFGRQPEEVLEVCSNCMDEFKEFMQRKNQRFIPKEGKR